MSTDPKQQLTATLASIPRQPSTGGHATPSFAMELPASSAQQGLWFAHQLFRNPAAHNSAHCFRIRGGLQTEILEKSLREIVRRHQVLRTNFAISDGQLMQRIRPEWKIVLERVLLDKHSNEAVASLVRAAIERPFELEAEPLFRVLVIEIERHEHVLLFVAHHLVCDGASFMLFLSELGELYSAYASGKPSPLPELPLQYADFATSQRKSFENTSTAAQLAYWTRKLCGTTGRLDLASARINATSLEGRSSTFGLSKHVCESLRVLARRSKATPFMVFLAAWAAMVYRCTDRRTSSLERPCPVVEVRKSSL